MSIARLLRAADREALQGVVRARDSEWRTPEGKNLLYHLEGWGEDELGFRVISRPLAVDPAALLAGRLRWDRLVCRVGFAAAVEAVRRAAKRRLASVAMPIDRRGGGE